MIKMFILGNIGRDAQIQTVNGKGLISFPVCHTEKWKDAQGVQHERSTWIEVSKWGDSVNVANYIRKGGQIFVEGTPSVQAFKTKNGENGASLKLNATFIQLLGSKPQETSNSSVVTPSVSSDEEISDLPF